MSYEAFAEEFVAAGGRFVFGVTGSGPSLQLIDGLERAGARFVGTGHEATAALLAGASNRYAQAPALAVSIKGPGFMNMAPGLLCNAYEGLPSISVSESYPRGYRGERCHKSLEHLAVGAPFLKRQYLFDARVGAFGRAWATASAEAPGPVHIDLVEGTNPAEAGTAAIPGDAGPVLERIERASRPVLVVGACASRVPAWMQRIRELRLPVFTTPAAKGVIAETSPFAAGVYTGAGKDSTPERVVPREADLVLTLGVRCGEMLDPALHADRVLRVDLAAVEGVFPSSAAQDVRRLDAEGVEALLGAMARHHWGADVIAESFGGLDAIVSRYGWSVVRAMRLVQSMLPGAVHVLDTGNFAVLGEHFLLAGAPQDVSGTPNGRYMGGALGYALGAALVRPDSLVVLWIGDGGLRSMLGELGLAADLGLRLLILVVRDGHYGSIRGAALSGGLTQTPVNLPPRSFGRFAEALGLRSAWAPDEPSLQRVVEHWVADPAPTLCECPTDPDAYIALTSHFR